jgi:DNA polymerase-3 subunit beta
MPDGEFGHAFTLAAGDLKRLIDKTKFAIPGGVERFYLNGIYLHTVDVKGHRMLRAVATNGYRLALAEILAPDGAIGMPGVIVPRNAASAVQKLCAKYYGKVHIEIGARRGHVRFDTGQVLTVKFIDGRFPDYAHLIPSGNDKRLIVDRKKLAAAIRHVMRIVPREIAIMVAVAGAKLMLSITNPDSGSATEELDIEYGSSPIDIYLNACYFLDITKHLDGDTMLITIADRVSPIFVQDRDDTTGLLHVLMPMRDDWKS